MRALLAGVTAVAALWAGSAMAEDWPADGPTCAGAYDALHQKKADLGLTSAEAEAVPNFKTIDFGKRAGDPKLMAGVPEYQQGDWEDYSENFAMMLMMGMINLDPKPIMEVMGVAARCDAKFGFKPALGPVGAKPAPPPPKAPPVVAAPPAPPAPKVDDRSCAVSYLALSYGNQADPALAQTFMQRADGAGMRYLGNNPKFDKATVVREIQTSAEARVKAILIDKTAPAEPLFAEMRACDARYALPPPPQTPKR